MVANGMVLIGRVPRTHSSFDCRGKKSQLNTSLTSQTSESVKSVFNSVYVTSKKLYNCVTLHFYNCRKNIMILFQQYCKE